MSEQNVIKLKFKGLEINAKIFPSYEQLFSFFKTYFSIDEERAKNLILFYYDEDGDQTDIGNESDYKIFLDNQEVERKIEGEIDEEENGEDMLLKNREIFPKKVDEQHVNISINNNG